MSFVQFFVPGIPQPHGSKTVNRHTGSMYDTNKKLMPWRTDMIGCAHQAMTSQSRSQFLGPVRVQLIAVFPRPKSHYGTGRNADLLKDSAPSFHCQKPDADKLARAVLDALTIAGVWRDDAQASFVSIQKNWGGGTYTPGMSIFVQDAIGDDVPLPRHQRPIETMETLL